MTEPTTGPAVRTERDGPVGIVTLDRPEVRNAVDRPTAEALADAVLHLDEDPDVAVIVLAGDHGTFCAGADLGAIADPSGARVNDLTPPDGASTQPGPMGPSRFVLDTPTIAAVEGWAVAGGTELALWADLRVVAQDAVFGIFCRRWGVPLIDGGTVRLPRLIGHSRAMDLILTGRPVEADEALAIGLANRVVPTGTARDAAVAMAKELAAFPQTCLRNDRRSAIDQWDLPFADAMANEFTLGMASLADGGVEGAARFASGEGRGGSFA